MAALKCICLVITAGVMYRLVVTAVEVCFVVQHCSHSIGCKQCRCVCHRHLNSTACVHEFLEKQLHQ